MNKKITFLTLCLWLTAVTFPVFAQQESDTTYTFRFVPEETVFVTDTPSETKVAGDYQFALRANLLRWATLTPDVGIEWRVSPSVGIVVNGTWTAWTWRDNHRRYALWEVMPEVRWYLDESKDWYVGAMFKAGQFNYNLADNGRQGDLMGGGFTGGYQLRLSNALSLDFSLALGYLHADCERYEVTNGVPERVEEGTKNWWGPINAGVTLVWKLF